MGRELHPETAQHIGELATMTVGNAELIMSVILEMQLDHVRVDAEMQTQADRLIAADNGHIAHLSGHQG